MFSRTQKSVPKKLMTDVSGAPERKTSRPALAIFVLVVLLLLAMSIAGYFYYQFKHTMQAQDVKEVEELSTTIGKFMELPSGEVPTLATVTDREKLAEQPFFQKAENGDKVLIYSQSGRAILYRPSTKKIVDVTTVNVNTPTPIAPVEQSASQEGVAPTSPPESAIPVIVRVALLNGSMTAGAASSVENQLKPIFPNVAVVSKEAAKKNNYGETVVVDVTGKNGKIAQEIATALSGSVRSTPEGEITPTDADILVIVADKK